MSAPCAESANRAGARLGLTLTIAWVRGALCVCLLLSCLPAIGSANSDCSCVPDNALPEGNLAVLRNVASGGKASSVVKSVTVRLRAEDVTPGSCTTESSSDPVTVSLLLVDDDGDVILNQAKPGFVCNAGQTTSAKFTARFEGPKNCEGSVAPAQQVTHGDIAVTATTDDGALTATRQILCRSDKALIVAEPRACPVTFPMCAVPRI